jgi:hypothetical protein
MTDDCVLERRYRLLLACYPKPFRREHEREMLAVLMAGSPDGQRWPRLADAADLLGHATVMRIRRQFLRSWAFERRRPRLFLGVHLASGIWLLVLTAILYGYDRGGLWGAMLVPAAALHFYVAYRLRRTLVGALV